MQFQSAIKLLAVTTILVGASIHSTQATAASPEKSLPAGAGQDNQGYFATGRLLVKAKPGISETKFLNILAKRGAHSKRKINKINVHVVEVPPGLEKKIIEELTADPSVDFVELDRLMPAGAIPNDPSFASQWHHTKIGTTAAWDSANANNITIAILDTGVNSAHPDLAAQIVPGWNVVSQNNDTSDINGHGTAVAGSAAAIVNNAVGVSGVAQGAKIMPVRITNDPTSNAYWSDVANGVTLAADRGARIVSNSYASHESSTVSSAAQYLISRGGLLFTCAHNQNINTGFTENPYIMTIAATDANDAKASFSNYGAFVDVSAPGTNILTTNTGGGYNYWNGTSFSTPITAGLAALMLGAKPTLSPNDVQNILKSTAVDLGTPGRDDFFGYGRINAASAVSTALVYTPTVNDTAAPTASITNPLGGSTVNGVVPVYVNATDNIGVTKVDLFINGSLLATDASAPFNFAWDTTALGNLSRVNLTAKAYDAAGNIGSAPSVTVNVMNTADVTPPIVTITSPANNAKVSGNVSIKATARDDFTVTSMQLYLDGTKVANSTTGSVSYTWNTRKAGAGSHYIIVEAIDNSGNVGKSTINVVK